jgi:hypothetical protein
MLAMEVSPEDFVRSTQGYTLPDIGQGRSSDRLAIIYAAAMRFPMQFAFASRLFGGACHGTGLQLNAKRPGGPGR